MNRAQQAAHKPGEKAVVLGQLAASIRSISEGKGRLWDGSRARR